LLDRHPKEDLIAALEHSDGGTIAVIEVIVERAKSRRGPSSDDG
jgi:hypothetical protein